MTAAFSPTNPEVTPLSVVDIEWLADHRALSLIEVHADQSGTTRTWFISPEQAEQIAEMLGEADTSSLVPPGSVHEFVAMSEGLPTYDR